MQGYAVFEDRLACIVDREIFPKLIDKFHTISFRISGGVWGVLDIMILKFICSNRHVMPDGRGPP